VTAEGATVTKKIVHKRAKALAKARTLIVQVPATTQASVLDDAVRQSLVQASTTLLTAVRSAAEVKLERNMAAQAQVSRMADAGTPQEQRRRRLEDANGQNGDNQNQQQDLSDIYYVSMTPNIMAGLLFFFLFTFVAYVGLTCMGMIAGQDVYVKRMPTIGREA
jgi:ABC-type Na+ efflux pump permease subunit